MKTTIALEVISMLLRFGLRKFGSPSQEVLVKLNSLHDIDRLDCMTDQLLTVGSWEEVLAVE